MELQQLSLGSKVKMKPEQPIFKCSGRDDVTCYYKGTVTQVFANCVRISFKYKGEYRENLYDIVNNTFVKEELKDIKIVKIS